MPRRAHARRSRNASSSRSSASARIGRGVAKLKRNQVSPPGPNCGPGLAENPRPAADARGNIVRLKSGSRKIRPGKIRGVEPHRPRTGRRSLDSRIEQISIALEIWQQLIKPAVAGSPRRFRRHHAEGIIGAKSTRRDTGIDPALQRDVRRHAGADMGAGKIESLGSGDARDQAIGDIGRGDDRWSVPGAIENKIAMDFVGNRNQIVLAAEGGERANLLSRPNRATRIMRATEKHDPGARRQRRAQGVEIHHVAALTLDQLRIEDASVVGQNDPAERMIDWREYHDLVTRFADGLQDEAQPRHDTRSLAHPRRIELTGRADAPANRQSAAAQLPVSA